MILAGDVGGTKCNLALFEYREGTLHRVAQRRFPSKEYSHLERIISEFLREPGPEGSKEVTGEITAAGFGVAGPVINERVQATNLPWLVDAAALGTHLGLRRVALLNDLEAAAYSLAVLKPDEFYTLNEGMPNPKGHRALIAAGTGLGEAILFWDGQRHRVVPTEAGHSDFAARTEREIELLRSLKRHSPQVSIEMVLSGRGFRTIHEFLDPGVKHPTFDEPESDPAPEISRLGLAGKCPVCVQTLDMWTAIYGAEAGNLALRVLPRGGVYVAGGMAVKNLAKLKDGTFFQAFCDKEKLGILLTQIPIYVVLNEDAPLLGAASQAIALAMA